MIAMLYLVNYDENMDTEALEDIIIVKPAENVTMKNQVKKQRKITEPWCCFLI